MLKNCRMNQYLKYSGTKILVVIVTLALVFATSQMVAQRRFNIKDIYNAGGDAIDLAASQAEVLARILGPVSNDDPRLLQHIRERVLIAPSTEPYNLQVDLDKDDTNAYKYNSYRRDDNWITLDAIVKSIFENEPPGFFVEAGALDGEYLSNSLYLERDLGWSGLLVEATVYSYESLLTKHRKAWSAHACLATHPYPHTASLVKLSKQGSHLEPQERIGLMNHNALTDAVGLDIRTGMTYTTYEQVQCFPLQAILNALNVTHVNFISLDIEGVEDKMLSSFWGSGIEVDVWMIEHLNSKKLPHEKDVIDTKFIKEFEERGYSLYTIHKGQPMDYVFIKSETEIHKKAFEKRPQQFDIE